MTKVIMTKGLPGCGKTTWAKEYQSKDPNTIRINKDDLRAMLHNSIHSKGREALVLEIRDSILMRALTQGHSVIIDDTNLNPIHEAGLKALAQTMGAEFEVVSFLDVPIEECIKRDSKRPNYVGERVIKQQYKEWLKPKPLPPTPPDPSLPDAIICDLDGTLALFGDANPYDRDFTKDIVNEPVKGTLLALGKPGVEVVFVSGRKDIFRDQTEQWLRQNWGPYYHLYMRKTQPEGMQEPKDVVVKEQIYNEEIKGKYNVQLVLDDRDQVVSFWRSQGLTVFQVAEGDF